MTNFSVDSMSRQHPILINGLSVSGVRGPLLPAPETLSAQAVVVPGPVPGRPLTLRPLEPAGGFLANRGAARDGLDRDKIFSLFQQRLRREAGPKALAQQAHEALAALLKPSLPLTPPVKQRVTTEPLSFRGGVVPGLGESLGSRPRLQPPNALGTVGGASLTERPLAPRRTEAGEAAGPPVPRGGVFLGVGSNRAANETINLASQRRLATNVRSALVPVKTVNILDLVL